MEKTIIHDDSNNYNINTICKATIGRLPRYLKYLKLLDQNTDIYISATKIAKALQLGEVQVRKDLNAVSGAGRPKIGYIIDDLIKCIEDVLGFNNKTNAIIVGAGRLGRAILKYSGFDDYGINILKAFDNKNYDNDDILPMTMLSQFCKENNVKIGIITVNEQSAQEVYEILVKNNIKAIWNFTKYNFQANDNVIIKNENLALSIAYLNNQLMSQNRRNYI